MKPLDPGKDPKTPIRMQRVMIEYGISTTALAKHVLKGDGSSISRTLLSLTINYGRIPGTIPDYTAQVEAGLRAMGVPEAKIKTVWELENNVVPIGSNPHWQGHRARAATHPGQNNEHDNTQEAELLTAESLTITTIKHFGLLKDPFDNDIQSIDDIYISESHLYAYHAMMDAARHGGFVTISGECGSGKTVIRQKLVFDLRDVEDIRIIRPQVIDKKELTASHVLDSIIFDLAPHAKPKRTKEAKARQVRDTLVEAAAGGCRHVLMIEETHDIPDATLKLLKRLWEIDDGFKKLLGIVLVAQPELLGRFDIHTNPQLREVALRCHRFVISPLSHFDLEKYVALKFRRATKKAANIFRDDCSEAIMKNLTDRWGNPMTYPLYINNLLARAMNTTAQIGAPIVTPEIIGKV